ncbi:hypothetical protein EVAR_7032_1 [Eumeta japonica]|uniref:Uncharacterized protein n=1 Tax=Eumeta variegata TaxID=151549 RepID=A0A4C1YPR0_EUMVA|nr:hypothetical protein EVAR_7032_1 [Eumeta japonica]
MTHYTLSTRHEQESRKAATYPLRSRRRYIDQQSSQHANHLRLRGQTVEWKGCVRYLSVHIDRSLRIVSQVNNVIQMSRDGCGKNIVLRMIVGASWFVKNDVIARDLKVEILEKFIKMLALRIFNHANAGPYISLHNLAPQYAQLPGGYLVPRNLLPFPPSEDKV